MRFHVVSLPHSQTTKEYDTCAFTAKVRKFCDMMSSLGHQVVLYAGDENEAEVSTLVTCITREEQQDLGVPGPERVFDASFDARDPQWTLFMYRAQASLSMLKEPGEFLCMMGGTNHQPLAAANPDLIPVEFGIGYPGSWAPFRVFESYAWMHASYGAQQGLQAADGNFYDAVIPSYFEPEAFPLGTGKGDYLLYIGRLTARKGLEVARATSERTGLRLVVAGAGDATVPAGAEYVGHANPQQRAKLYMEARATMVPTLYVEPFGSVACESMLCGTPVLTTDWGAFTETVEQGVTGYRCRDLGEFAWAARNAKGLRRKSIRKQALDRWAMSNVRYQYDEYFKRLAGLNTGKDFYTADEREPA